MAWPFLLSSTHLRVELFRYKNNYLAMTTSSNYFFILTLINLIRFLCLRILLNLLTIPIS